MRLNQFIAQCSGLSRRAADTAIKAGRVTVNDRPARLGASVSSNDKVILDALVLTPTKKTITILLNKPTDYVCSRDGQGSKTIYNLLPKKYHKLKPVGRLDKDSSGLILLTNDGQLAQRLTHPSFQKEKVYEVELDNPLTGKDKVAINTGVMLEDGMSRLQLTVDSKQQKTVNRQLPAVNYLVRMHEGRNRQIRRTFVALGYNVTKLHRTKFGNYSVSSLSQGEFCSIDKNILKYTDVV